MTLGELAMLLGGPITGAVTAWALSRRTDLEARVRALEIALPSLATRLASIEELLREMRKDVKQLIG